MRKSNRSGFFSRLIVGLSVLVVAGCSQQPVVPANLVEAKFECKDQPIRPGTDALIKGSLKNTGGEFKGIKITLKGVAVSQGVLSMPAAAKSKLECRYSAQKDLVMASANPSFHKIDNDTLEATIPEFDCKGDIIDLTMAMPAARNGRGDLQIIIAPISDPDKASTYVLTVEVHQMTGIFMGT